MSDRQNEREETVETLYGFLVAGDEILHNNQRCKFAKSKYTSFLVYLTGPNDGCTVDPPLRIEDKVHKIVKKG